MTALANTSTSKLTASEPLLTFVRGLFDSLMAQLGGKVYDQFGATNPETVQREWAAGLVGFRRRELQRGLEAMRTRRFVPTLGEFSQLCRPCLDPEYAWHEAQDGLRARDLGEHGVWTHPAVYRAAVAMGGLGISVRKGSFPQSRRRWEMTLNRELAAGWGEEVPEPAPLIANAPALRDIPSDVRKKLSDLSKSFTRKEL